jgi:hypothetical protein
MLVDLSDYIYLYIYIYIYVCVWGGGGGWVGGCVGVFVCGCVGVCLVCVWVGGCLCVCVCVCAVLMFMILVLVVNLIESYVYFSIYIFTILFYNFIVKNRSDKVVIKYLHLHRISLYEGIIQRFIKCYLCHFHLSQYQ